MTLNITVFDDPIISANFKPLTYTRAAFELPLGAKSILDRLLEAIEPSNVSLMVPEYLKDVIRERNPRLTVNPDNVSKDSIIVNGLFDPSRKDLLEKASSDNKKFIILDQGVVAAARLDEPHLSKMMHAVRERRPYAETISNAAPILEATNTLVAKHPWRLVELIKEALAEDSMRIDDSATVIPSNIYIKGDRSALKIADDAVLEGFVTFDTRLGPILVDEKCEIHSFTRISGPSYIGKKSLVKPSTIIEGSIIGAHCKVGGEISNSIILNYSNKAHLGYIGHSIIGEWVNLGAGTNNSDLKNTYGEVKVKIEGKAVNTERVKVGCFIGDGVKSSIGTQITTGRKIGPHSHIGGLIDSDIPPFTYCPKGPSEGYEPLDLEKAIQVQRRMMSRRGQNLTETYERMIKELFEILKREKT